MTNEKLVDIVINELNDGWNNPNFGKGLKGLKDLQLLSELEDLRPDLKSLLEEELVNAQSAFEEEQRKAKYGPILVAVGHIARECVYNLIDSRFDQNAIKVSSITLVHPYAEMYEDGSVEAGADVSLLTGVTTPRGNMVSDHKYLKKVLDFETVSFNGFDPNSELVLRRIGKPQVINSEQDMKTPRGIVHYSQSVQVRYSVKMPQETAQAVYDHSIQQKQ